MIRGGSAYRQHTSFKEAIRRRDNYTCQLCGCRVGEVCNLHYAPVSQIDVAHIVPFKYGGLSTPDNMRVLCHPCNKRESCNTQAQAVFQGLPRIREGVHRPVPVPKRPALIAPMATVQVQAGIR